MSLTLLDVSTQHAHHCKLVGDDGIEPPQADSKSAALPLCKSPVENYFFFLDFTEHPFTLVELILIVLPLFVFLLCVFL